MQAGILGNCLAHIGYGATCGFVGIMLVICKFLCLTVSPIVHEQANNLLCQVITLLCCQLGNLDQAPLSSLNGFVVFADGSIEFRQFFVLSVRGCPVFRLANQHFETIGLCLQFTFLQCGIPSVSILSDYSLVVGEYVCHAFPDIFSLSLIACHT